MHVHFLDPYRPGRSPVHALDARIKLVLVLGFILTVGLTPVNAWPVYLILLALSFSLAILSGLGLKYIHRRALAVLPFLLAALPVIFTRGERTLFELTLGTWVISAKSEGLALFLSVALKAWISVQAAIVLAGSTPFPELLQAMRAVRMPRLLVAMVGLTWRYMFVLVDEVLRLLRARSARSGAAEGGQRSGGSLVWRARVTGGMAGSLFLRALERSDRIHMAMVSRGYDGEVRALPMPAIRPSAWLALLAGLLSCLALLLVSFVLWG